MEHQTFIAEVGQMIERRTRAFLEQHRAAEVLSIAELEQVALAAARETMRASFVAWRDLVKELGMALGRPCPACGARRKVRWRKDEPIVVELLTGKLEVGKPYLQCATQGCEGNGLSVMTLLTGLASGDSTVGLMLQAAREGAEDTYGKARAALRDGPLGTAVERTKVRRLCLQVEQEATRFAEQRRQEALAASREARESSQVRVLVVEGDGGSVRVGELVKPERGDRAFGKKTPARQLDRRRRATTYRELVTFDAREPGAKEPTAVDALVPVQAANSRDEKARRMRALVARKALAPDGQVYGLGDMGSGLARAFDDAFGDSGFWAADKHHTWEYVKKAASVLVGLDVVRWDRNMREAILDRDEQRRDQLVEQAERHKSPDRVAAFERCPVHALRTYLTNHWEHIRFKEMEALDLPTVSARAESQVRERTKGRFSVPGAWRLENIEGKAILRGFILDGSYLEFAAWYYQQRTRRFQDELGARLERAVQEMRVTAEAAALLLAPSVTVAEILRAHQNQDQPKDRDKPRNQDKSRPKDKSQPKGPEQYKPNDQDREEELDRAA